MWVKGRVERVLCFGVFYGVIVECVDSEGEECHQAEGYGKGEGCFQPEENGAALSAGLVAHCSFLLIGVGKRRRVWECRAAWSCQVAKIS